MASKKTDPQFHGTTKRYRCERCVGAIREEVIYKTTNPHWYPRCNDCGRPMKQIDKLDRFIKPKPEMPGQMGFDGTVVAAPVPTKSVKKRAS